MSYLEFWVGDISSHSFILGQAFCFLCKPPFSWFTQVIARAIACASCQDLNINYLWKKKKIFIYFIKCEQKIFDLLWSKTKKHLVVLHKDEINCLHVYYLISLLYLVCLFSFFMQNWILQYTCKYFFHHVLNFFFYNLIFLKALVMCFAFSLKEWETCPWFCFFWFFWKFFLYSIF